MSYRVTWTKEMRASAAERGKALFAVGIDQAGGSACRFGRAEVASFADGKTASGLIFFAMALSRGESPQEAFNAVDWEAGTPKETVKPINHES